MLPKIDPVNYEKCYPKRLKKIFQSHMNMKTYDQFIPHVERAIVGNIPPELIRMFPKETRGHDIKEFQKVLADISNFIRANYSEIRMVNELVFNPQTYTSKLCKDGLLKTTNDVLNARLKSFSDTQLTGNLEYIDKGIAGKVFRLSIMDKDGNKIMHDKALKVYHNTRFIDPATRIFHGNYAEANFWTYLKRAVGHRLDKTQFTKHYISDLNNGYTLTEFLDAEIPKTTAKVDFQNLFRIKYNDGHHNPRYFGKMYDAGGFEKMSKFIDDKIVLRYFKKLFFRSKKELPEVLTRYEAMAQNPETPHRDKIQKAINLFKKF